MSETGSSAEERACSDCGLPVKPPKRGYTVLVWWEDEVDDWQATVYRDGKHLHSVRPDDLPEVIGHAAAVVIQDGWVTRLERRSRSQADEDKQSNDREESVMGREPVGGAEGRLMRLQSGRTLPELAKLAQIEYRTAHIWMKRGLLKPSIHESEGTGDPARFSEDDVKHAITLRVLRRWLSLDGLAAVAESPVSRSHLQKVLTKLDEQTAVPDSERDSVAANLRRARSHLLSDEVVERVSAAIADADGYVYKYLEDRTPPDGDIDRESFRKLARAALQAALGDK